MPQRRITQSGHPLRIATHWSLGIACVLLLAMLSAPNAQGQRPGAPAPALKFDDANVLIDRIPDGWEQNALSLQSGNGVIFSAAHAFNESLVLINSTAIGAEHEPTPDTQADELTADFLQGGTMEIRSTERSAKTVAGINGMRVTIRGATNGKRVSIVGWVGALNGREYRVTIIAPGTEANAVLMLNEWLAQFRLIDPTLRLASADLPAPKPFTSRRFGFTVPLPAGVGWLPTKTESTGLPHAEYSAAIGGHTFFAVQAIYVGIDADPEVVARAMSQFTHNPWDGAASRAPLDLKNGFAGYQLSVNASGKDQPCHFRTTILRGRHCALMFMGWTTRKDQLANLENAARSVQLDQLPAPGQPKAPTRRFDSIAAIFEPRKAPPPESVVGMAQNAMGLLSLAKGDAAVAARLFESALEDRMEAAICFNWMRALVESGDYTRLMELLPLALKQFPEDESIASEAATGYELARQPDKALEIYRVLFPKLHDDERFARFIQMLLDRHDTDLAKRHIAAYRLHTDNDLVAALEADTLMEMNEFAKAASLLKKRITSRMPDEHMLMSYCAALVKSERLDEATRQLDTLEAQNGASASLYVIRGHTLAIAGDFEKAKQAYEAALKISPNDLEIQQYVKSASAYVGQGNNTALNTSIDPVPLDDTYLTQAAKELDRSAGAGYRLYAKATRFLANQKEKTTTYQIIDIYDQNGVDAFSTITLELEPLAERLYVNTLEVLDESGKVIEKGKPESYYVQDKAEESVASFRQLACLPVPGLRPGCTIRLVATRESRLPDEKLRFTEEWLGHRYPTAVSVFCVSGDVANLKSVERNGAKKEAKPGQIVWTTTNPQRMYLEPLMPPVSSFVPYVAVVDARTSWKAEAETYLKLIAPRLMPNDALKAEVQSLGIDGKTAPQKMRAIVDHVDKKFTYKALAFGPRARMPTDPAEIIRNRYGDCKDMSLLTHLMLREAGIASNLAIVRAGGSVTPELASLDQFDHMIVNVPDCGGTWWIDCTGDNIDPIMPTPAPIYLEGRDALILDGENSKLVHLPEWDASTSNVEIERLVRLLPDGQLAVSDSVQMNGAIAHYYRSALRSTEASRRESQIAAMCALQTNEIRDLHASADGVDDYLQPFSMRVEYSPRQKMRTAGTRLVGDLPAALERQLLSPELIENRQTPMCVQMGMHVRVKVSLALPPGMSLEGVDNAPQTLSGKFGKGEIRFARAGSGYTGELNLQSPPVTAPANEYEAFCNWRQSVVDTWTIPLIVNRGK